MIEYRSIADGAKQFPGDRLVRALISAEVADRMGETLIAAGCDLTAYRTNPVVLWAHDAYSLPPIGKATEVWTEEGVGVWAVDEFAGTPFAQEVYDLYKGGFLSAFSVGFRVQARDNSGSVIREWELLEHSAVAVPANPQALVKAATEHGSDAAALILRAYYPEAKDDAEAVRIATDLRRLTGAAQSLRNIHRHYVKQGLAAPVAEAALAPALDVLKQIAPGLFEATAPAPQPEPDPAAGVQSDAQLQALTAQLAELRAAVEQRAATGKAIAELVADRNRRLRSSIGGTRS